MAEKALRHAYMIITHGSFDILEAQLRFLDSENADFFIHLDTHVAEFDFDYYRAIPKKSSVTFVDRIRISWGHYSLAECELILLKAAVKGNYDYYHLLSGVDVPVKSREYIENYFAERNGTNFLCFQNAEITPYHRERVKYYYPCQRWNIRNHAVRLGLRMVTTYAQKLVGVDRTRKYAPGYVFQKGTQWFSITHELALYLVEHEQEIYEKFHSTFCADEIFIHSLVMNSPFLSTLPETAFDSAQGHRACCRYIDWERGKPYSFTEAEYEELISLDGDYLFARKFDSKNHGEVINKLFAYFGGENDHA